MAKTKKKILGLIKLQIPGWSGFGPKRLEYYGILQSF